MNNSWLNTSAASTMLAFAVPLILGLYSVFLGADTNWDLFNYHRYTPFELLNGKLDLDLAPAGFQGYFNPLADIPAYWLDTSFPPRIAGFFLGVLHGLVFPLVLFISRRILSDLPAEDSFRLPLLISAAACLMPNFLSALGNGMGDNMTAVPILASLALLLSIWSALAKTDIRIFALLVLGGLLIGMSIGLKPTNGSFAIGGCGAMLLTAPGSFLIRLRTSFLLGCGILLGFVMTGGYWMMQLWQTFGNPLFPQFSSVLPNMLASPLSIGDTRWLPHGFAEAVFWPFLFTVNPHRVGELSIHQLIWPAAYVLLVVWIAISLWNATKSRRSAAESRSAFLLAFISIGYVVWMGLFSIIRYAVVIEVLLPLAVFILLSKWQSYARAKVLSGWLVGVSTAYMIIAGLPNWGHQDWADPLYHADVPSIATPAQTTILLVTAPGERPLSWLIPFFSPEIAFFGLENSFPASGSFAKEVQARIANRGGPIYVMTDFPVDRGLLKMASYNVLATQLGLTRSDAGCATLALVIRTMHLHAVVATDVAAPAVCRAALPPEKIQNISALRQPYIDNARQVLQRSGFLLDEASCKAYAAGIGKGVYDYEFCIVRRVTEAAS